MVVFALDNSSESMRGLLSRWTLEIKPGVFVGNFSSRVRQYIWEHIIGEAMNPQAIMVYSYPSEQGYVIESYGDPYRYVCDLDGLQLIGNIIDRKDAVHKVITLRE